MVLRSGSSVEHLESRVLMAVSITLTDKGKLTIEAPPGDTGGDVIEVALVEGSKNQVQIWLNGAPFDPRPNNPQTTVKRDRLERIVADMGAGDDRVIVGRRENAERVYHTKLYVKCRISGGDGNDYLEAGRADDILIGGAGNDILLGWRGDDFLLGGTGDDQLFGEAGRDNLIGQDGNDLLDGGGNEDALYGMAGADNLIGGEDDDFLDAAPGPGDVLDENEKDDEGGTDDVTAYVAKLINIGVPDRFKDDARS